MDGPTSRSDCYHQNQNQNSPQHQHHLATFTLPGGPAACVAAGSKQREQQQQQKQLPKQQRQRQHPKHGGLVPLPEDIAVEAEGSVDREPVGLGLRGAAAAGEHLPHDQQPQHGSVDHQQTLGHCQIGRGVIFALNRKFYVNRQLQK